MMEKSTVSTSDVERDAIDKSYLENATIHNFSWRKVKVETKTWKSDLKPKSILSNIDGYAEAGIIASTRSMNNH